MPEIPEINDLDLDYRYLPKGEVSGDFLIINEISKNKMSIFLGDVSGHGVSAALITSFSIALINKVHNDLGSNPDVFFFNRLNKELINFIPKDNYLTAIYGIYYKENNEHFFSFTRGGHPYPVLWDSEKNDAYVIKSEGAPLGFQLNIEHEIKDIKLRKGDALFLFTDGLIEALDKNNEELGFNGLVSIIKNTMKHKYSLKKSLDIIISEVGLHEEKVNIRDDKILVGLSVK